MLTPFITRPPLQDRTTSSAALGVLVLRKAGDAPWDMTTSQLSNPLPESLVLLAAVAAYLGRYRGQTRQHAESDLRVFLRWCARQSVDR
jgi:hypothetical protein